MCLIESIYEQNEGKEREREKERQRNEWWTFISLRNEQIEFCDISLLFCIRNVTYSFSIFLS